MLTEKKAIERDVVEMMCTELLVPQDVKCSKIVYRLCNHMVYSFDILKASQKKRKRWRWLGRKGLWK